MDLETSYKVTDLDIKFHLKSETTIYACVNGMQFRPHVIQSQKIL